MQRRRLLTLGVISAVVLTIGGGTLALLEPGLQGGRLSAGARNVFTAVAKAVLEGSLPDPEHGKTAALQGLIDRIDALQASLPPHAQAELSQLLSLLASSPGRRALAGVSSDWAVATVIEIQEGLQSMRFSGISLRQQAYHALHDIVSGAYFSDAQTWGRIGYPGPVNLKEDR